MGAEKTEVKAEISVKEIARLNLRRMVRDSGLKEKVLCLLLGISYGTFRNYLNGFSEPTVTHINVICSYFKITADQFLGRDDGEIDEIGEIGLDFGREIDDVHPQIAELSLKLFRHSLVVLKDDARLSENATRLGPKEKKLGKRYSVKRKA